MIIFIKAMVSFLNFLLSLLTREHQKNWLIKFIDMLIDGLNTNTLGYMYKGSFHAFPPGEDKDDLINSLTLKKEKYTTPPTEKQGSFSLFTSNKISPTSGGKKLLTYKLLNCSIKCSKQLFTGTSINDVIHSIANYLLPNIKTLVVSKLTILHLQTNKTYTYNLLYKFKTIHNTTIRSLSYNTLAIVNIEQINH